MNLIYDGPVAVHYRQIYVVFPNCDAVIPDQAFIQHRNGLCGAAVAGTLFLCTGLHTGYVRLRVEIHSAEPPLDEAWEEVVEVSTRFDHFPLWVETWDSDHVCPLPLNADMYRVRYAAKGFGEAEERCVNESADEPLLEHYTLQFWPASWRPDDVLRETRPWAAYFNNGAWG